MKIRSVSIQAFKSYLKAEDGNFDFTTDGETPANFVALYAPNGFGKTSFFDAVDFAITGRISRYSRDERIKQNKSDSKENNQQGRRQHLLRNNDADESIPTKIIVTTDDQNTQFISDHQIARRRSVDYQFPKTCKPGTDFLTKTMLSQEEIDAFLRETNAEGRYNKFATTVGGLDAVNKQRSALLAVKRDAESELGLLVNKIQELETEIAKLANQQNPTEEANAVVLRLNQAAVQNVSNVVFSTLKSKFTQLDHESFLSKWEAFHHKIQRDQETLVRKYAWGKEQLDSLLTIRRDIENLSILKKSESQAKLLLERKQELSKLEAEETEFKKLLAQIEGEVLQIDQFKAELDGYFKHRDAVAKLELVLKSTEEQEQQATKQLAAFERILAFTREQIGKSRLDQEKLLSTVQSATDNFKKLTELDLRLQNNTSALDELKKNKLKQDALVLSQERMIANVKRVNISDSFDAENIGFVSSDIILKMANLHGAFSQAQKDSEAVKFQLKLISERLQNTKLQSKQINDLIEIAAGIISKSEQSNCPLCQQQFDSFEALQQQIASNPLLSDTEHELTTKLQELKHQLSELETEMKKAAEQFTEILHQISSAVETDLKAAQLKSKTLEDQIDLLLKSIESDQAQIRELRAQVLNKSEADFSQHVAEERTVLKKKLDEAEAATKDAETEQKKLNTKNETLKHELQKMRAEKFELNECGKKFAELNQYLLSHRKVVNADKIDLQAFFDQESNQCKHQKRSLIDKIETISVQITKTVDLLTLTERSQPLDELLENRAKFISEITDLKSTLTPFVDLLSELKLTVPTNEDGWKTVEEHTKTWIHLLSKQSESMLAALSDAALLKALSEQALEFRNSEKLNTELKQLKLKQEAYTNICSNLSQDIRSLNAHIQAKANSYFKTKLINQLYRAIDPHPEFKNIEFACKMDGDKPPRLVISAVNPSTELRVAPTLTFSSAQINVLALSIFLAQALNVTDSKGKPVDCIFIDDPVQSIDSINTLSFIDLIRALCLRFNKQIIISTHDQNFHELLKKKMPSNLFPAKYLRLASFGKVVND
ncbi:AAA family ATPase [Coraliomargarita sp. W4R72]